MLKAALPALEEEGVPVGKPTPLPHDAGNPYPRSKPFQDALMHGHPGACGNPAEGALCDDLKRASKTDSAQEVCTLVPALSALHDLVQALRAAAERDA